MSDVSVYYFIRRRGPGSQELPSKRRAVLETIKGLGKAIMHSLRVVDHTEVDSNGFLVGGACDGSRPVDEIWSRIRSFESRAKSRDREALDIAGAADSDRKDELLIESLELRSAARALRYSVSR